MTTARDYTKDATKETWVKTSRGQEGVWQSIDLYGFEDIVKWLNLPSLVPYEPWASFTNGIQLSDWR